MPAHPAPGPADAPVGTHVHVLHRFGQPTEISLHHSYRAALAALATAVRANWSRITHCDDVPASPDGLSDAQVVLAFYGGDGGGADPGAPTFGVTIDAGFAISEDVVAGAEPSEVSLRLGTLRVLDGDPEDPDVPAVTYCLDADGLTVAVFPGPDGYPTVLITPQEHLSGLPVTVRIEDPLQPSGFEQIHRVS